MRIFMKIKDIKLLESIINNYGAKESIKIFRRAMTSCANSYSDTGLKEKAIELSEVADILNDLIISFEDDSEEDECEEGCDCG